MTNSNEPSERGVQPDSTNTKRERSSAGVQRHGQSADFSGQGKRKREDVKKAGGEDSRAYKGRPASRGGFAGGDRRPSSGGFSGGDRRPSRGGFSGGDRRPSRGGFSGDDRRPSRGGFAGGDRRPSSGGFAGEDRRPSRGGFTGDDRRPSRGGFSGGDRRPSSGGFSGDDRRPSRGGFSGEDRRPSRGGFSGDDRRPSRGGFAGDDRRPSRGGFAGDDRRPSRGGFSGGDRRPSRGGFAGGDRRPSRGGFSGGDRRPSSGGFAGDDRRPSRGGFSGDDRRPSRGGFSGDDRRPSRGGFAGDDRRPSRGGFSGDDRRPSQSEDLLNASPTDSQNRLGNTDKRTSSFTNNPVNVRSYLVKEQSGDSSLDSRHPSFQEVNIPLPKKRSVLKKKQSLDAPIAKEPTITEQSTDQEATFNSDVEPPEESLTSETYDFDVEPTNINPVPSQSTVLQINVLAGEEILYGLNPVRLSLQANQRQAKHLYLSLEDRETSKEKRVLAELAESRQVPVSYHPAYELEGCLPETKHQGALLVTSKFMLRNLAELNLQQTKILALDHVQDVQNIGAIIRSACYFGFSAMIVTKDHAGPMNNHVSRFSAGMMELLPVYQVTNLVRSLESLKEKGYWTIATDIDGQSIYSFEPPEKYVLVLGNENKGLRRLVKEKSDFVVTIPGAHQAESLNVSVSAGICMAYLQKNITVL